MEAVGDTDFVPLMGKVKRCGPATIAVPAKY
jgi:hypothetical protein